MSDNNTPPPEDPTGPDLADIQNDVEEANISPAFSGEISLDEALAREAAKNAPPPLDPRKKKQILFGGIGIVLLVVLLSVYACQPKQGSMAFGICSTFLELNTPYPHTLRFSDLEGSRTAVRIYFTDVDPFGQYRQEMIECTFGPDAKMGMRLAEVKRNRRPVDPALVKEFNITLPTIMASDPYRVLPPDWENPLVPEYDREYNKQFDAQP